MALNVTTAVIGSGCNTATATPSLAQWDVGQVLKIEGVDLPAAYQVEFSTEYTRNAIQKIGNADGVAVPNVLLQRSAPITAYIVLHEGENDRETEYWITIHITPRTPPETITPDPEEQSVIDETIAALQAGVAAAEAAAAQAASKAAESAESAESAGRYESSARRSADNAFFSETEASRYATSAEGSAISAGASAASAEQSATIATEKAAEIVSSAEAARESASSAAGSASGAAGSARESAESAGQAANSASAASGSASQAAGSAQSASGSESSASQSATNAANSASTATTKAEEAASSAETAENAKNDAVTAKEAAEEAAGSVTDLAENLQETLDNIGAYGMNIVQVSGTEVTIAAEAETMYICGELASLEIESLPAQGIVFIIYQSGTTATVVDYPETLKMPAWWASAASETVMIGITNGTLGSVQTWA